MTAANFDACLAEVLAHEGGYVNHPSDPGGETNMGISKRSYPGENIKGMTRARAAAIYRRDFWDRVRGHDLPDGIDLVAFDPAVNSGVSRGAKWLQSALGTAQDGNIGPQTVAKAQTAPDAVKVIQRACAARMGFLRGLGTWGTFGKGWARRVASVEATAVAMSTRSTMAVRQEGRAASSTANAQAAGAAGAGAGGTAAGTGIEGLPDFAVYGLIAVAVVIAVLLVMRSRANRERARAYERKAKDMLS